MPFDGVPRNEGERPEPLPTPRALSRVVTALLAAAPLALMTGLSVYVAWAAWHLP